MLPVGSPRTPRAAAGPVLRGRSGSERGPAAAAGGGEARRWAPVLACMCALRGAFSEERPTGGCGSGRAAFRCRCVWKRWAAPRAAPAVKGVGADVRLACAWRAVSGVFALRGQPGGEGQSRLARRALAATSSVPDAGNFSLSPGYIKDLFEKTYG